VPRTTCDPAACAGLLDAIEAREERVGAHLRGPNRRKAR
jgi:hypothetical protein